MSRPLFPVVTVTFLGVVAVMFAIQQYLGTESLPVLVRLGALQPELLAAGEYWRLLTAGVLHGGYSHAGFTAFVLLALGASLERLIGSVRFALLLLVSIAGGFITSAWLLQSTLTVGASGGLWGLLGAYAVLAFSPLVHIPPDMKAQLRKSSIINLGLNAAVSFLPYVDWAAHLGGFVFGSLLFFLVLRHGLPDFDNLGDDEEPAPRPTGLALRIASALSCLAFVSALAIVFVHDKPFAFDAGYDEHVVNSKLLRADLTVPRQLQQSPSRDGAIFGNILKQPAVCTIRGAALAGIVSDAAQKKASAQHRAQLKEAPDNARPRGQVRVETRNGRIVTSARYGFPTGLLMQRAFATTRHADFFVECLTWPRFTAYADAAVRIAAGIESRPRPAPDNLERAQLDALAMPGVTPEPVQIGTVTWAPGLRVVQRSQTQSLMNIVTDPASTAGDGAAKVASLRRTRYSERDERVLAMSAGRPAQIAIRFGRVGQVVEATERPRATSAEDFAGKTFVLARTDTGVTVKTGAGEDVEPALASQVVRASLLFAGVDPLETLLAGRALQPGERLQLTREQAARYADIDDPDTVVDIALVFTGTYVRGAQRLAAFDVTWRQQQASGDGLRSVLEMHGTLGVGIADGATRETRLEGQADLSGAQVFGLGAVRVLEEAQRSP